VETLLNSDDTILPQIKAPPELSTENGEEPRFKLIVQAIRERKENLAAGLKKASNQALLNDTDNAGSYPLGIAAMSGWEHLVPRLIELDSQVDATDRLGNTALMAAAAIGNQPIVESLLSSKPDLTVRNKEDMSAVDLASTDGIRTLLHKCIIAGSLPKRKKRKKEDGEEDAIVFRVRVEGLSKIFLPDMLLEQVNALLKRMRSATPLRVEIGVDPISERPLGFAFLDFDEESEANFVLSQRGSFLGSVHVRFICEGPRKQNYESPED
jgi:hypothetical protein